MSTVKIEYKRMIKITENFEKKFETLLYDELLKIISIQRKMEINSILRYFIFIKLTKIQMLKGTKYLKNVLI